MKDAASRGFFQTISWFYPQGYTQGVMRWHYHRVHGSLCVSQTWLCVGGSSLPCESQCNNHQTKQYKWRMEFLLVIIWVLLIYHIDWLPEVDSKLGKFCPMIDQMYIYSFRYIAYSTYKSMYCNLFSIHSLLWVELSNATNFLMFRHFDDYYFSFIYPVS
jgi:hypothetical protein